MTGVWRDYRVSDDATHHTVARRPAYPARFTEVLKFHEPGLAPVIDDAGAYHILPDGSPAYPERYTRTFGFYEGRAAAQAHDGWLHILPEGKQLYRNRYLWCGNFQGGRCTVRDDEGRYFHIDQEGMRAYDAMYRYTGDFRDGVAVVQREDGRHTHIDGQGSNVHGKWYIDLDIYHKGFARARDSIGWHHIDLAGDALYPHRFAQAEPFYNGQARVEGFDGSLLVIDESGETVLVLRGHQTSPLDKLSGEMVGLWRTQTIRAAAELGVFDILPAPAQEIEGRLSLARGMGPRLMRALQELNLVHSDGERVYRSTDTGQLLQCSHLLSLRDAALHWGGDSYTAWKGLTDSLRTGRSSFTKIHGNSYFDRIAENHEELNSYHRAMATYARHDYRLLAETVDFGPHGSVLDAGGGTGELAFALLRRFPHLNATVMDRPEVVACATPPEDVADRCNFVAGDLFGKWPRSAGAVVLARVLHDWPDDAALSILARARESLTRGCALYVVEMMLEDGSGSGGLLDLNMLVMTGGAERTRERYAELLAATGFAIRDVLPTGAVSSVMLAEPL